MAVATKTKSAGSEERLRAGEIRKIEQQDGPEAAERAVLQFLNENRSSAQAFGILARLLSRQQRYDEAARAAEKACGLAPMEIEPILALGLLHARRRDHEAAGQAFANALKLDPDSTKALVGAAFSRYLAEDYEDALEILDRALALDPSLVKAKELKGRILLKRDDSDGALEVLEALVMEEPANGRALRSYLRLMKAANRTDDAYELIEKDAGAHPDDTMRARRLTRVALWAGHPEVALDQAARVLASAPKRPDFRVAYISALISAKKLDEAEEQIAELDQGKATAPLAERLRGDIALSKGDAKTALECYRKACRAARIDPLAPEDEAKGKTITDKARLWRSYSRRSLGSLLRTRRRERRARR